jgi:hypothetical protein
LTKKFLQKIGQTIKGVIQVNKKIILTVLGLALVLMATPYMGIVRATQPIAFSFEHWALGYGEPEYRQAGNNWISYASSYGVVTGDIVGEYAGNAHWIYHDWVGPYEDPYMLTVEKGNGNGLGTIDATLVMGMEKTGTINFRFNDVFGSDFAGTWVLFGGTGDLKGLRGQGTWHVEYIIVDGQIVGGYQVFEGQAHFEP